jgi:hypothetical protein
MLAFHLTQPLISADLFLSRGATALLCPTAPGPLPQSRTATPTPQRRFLHLETPRQKVNATFERRWTEIALRRRLA